MAQLPRRYSQFRDEFPAISRAYDGVSRLTDEAGPLDGKQIQLVRLAMAIGAGHEGAVHSHVRRALEAGATRDELRHVGLLALTTLGFSRMIIGMSWIDDLVGSAQEGKKKANPKRSR
jgi:4-carboxymuconolactone decarboxylase